MSTRSKNRRVIISEEYLDGCVGMSVRTPQEWDETVILVPAELMQRLARAKKTVRLIDDELREHLASGRRAANPKYVPDDQPE